MYMEVTVAEQEEGEAAVDKKYLVNMKLVQVVMPSEDGCRLEFADGTLDIVESYTYVHTWINEKAAWFK
jgi:hypothetical protein